MKPRTAIGIGSIITFITSIFSMLPQLMELFQKLAPFIEQLKDLFNAHAYGSAGVVGSAGVLSVLGYQAYTGGSAVKAALDKAVGNVSNLVVCATEFGGDHAASAVKHFASGLEDLSKAAVGAFAREAAEKKNNTPEQTNEQLGQITNALEQVVGVVNELRNPKQEDKPVEVK